MSPSASATSVALFRGLEEHRYEAIVHESAQLRDARRLPEQRALRAAAVRAFLRASGVGPGSLDAVVGRAGLLRPVESGTYRVDAALLHDAEHVSQGHPANLGAALADAIASEWRCPAFVVDPESADERDALVRAAEPFAGGEPRPVLAMKAATRRHARAVDRPLEAMRVVVVHLGAAATLCAVRDGRMVAVERPLESAIGEAAQLGETLLRAEAGDGRAFVLLQSAAYQIAKAIGALATVLEGAVDAVLLTGAIERAGPVVGEICRRVEWIAPVFPYREENELVVLAEAAVRVLQGAEPLKTYA